jgi:hypothetical protein
MRYQSAMHKMITTVFLLHFSSKSVVIEEETLKSVQASLKKIVAYSKWSAESTSDNIRGAAQSLLGVLTKRDSIMQVFRPQSFALRGIDKCGVSGCKITDGLRKCGRSVIISAVYGTLRMLD